MRHYCPNLVACAVILLSLAGCADQVMEPIVSGSPMDTERMLAHVEELSGDSYEGRLTGTPGAARARAYITSVLSKTGAVPCSGNAAFTDSVTVRRPAAGPVVNVLAQVDGTGSSDLRLVVSAHYDHLGIRGGQVYNGADDNASGTAAVLELARVFAATPPEHTIVFALFDFEEGGLNGARAFVDDPCGSGRMALNINLDMISRSRDSLLYAAGTYHYPYLIDTLDEVSVPEGMRVVYGHDLPGTGSEDWTSASDHAPFHAAGIPFLYFGVEDHAGYHDPSDDFREITPAFYSSVGGYLVDVISAFDEALGSLP